MDKSNDRKPHNRGWNFKPGFLVRFPLRALKSFVISHARWAIAIGVVFVFLLGILGYGAVRLSAKRMKYGELIVAQNGSGDFKSISEALRACPVGGKIIVYPGLYTESLVIDKPVMLEGRSSAQTLWDKWVGSKGIDTGGKVIIESESGSVLSIDALTAEIRGFVIVGKSGNKNVPSNAIDVQSGHLLIEDCDITSNSLAGIAWHGPEADPIIRRCRIHDTRQNGIVADRGAKGQIFDCEISSSTWPGVRISDYADPVFTRCRIHDGKASGIFGFNNGRGQFVECVVVKNAGPALDISLGAYPSISSSIMGQNNIGVFAHDGGGGKISETDLRNNSAGPWELDRPGPLLRENNREN